MNLNQLGIILLLISVLGGGCKSSKKQKPIPDSVRIDSAIRHKERYEMDTVGKKIQTDSGPQK